MLKIVLIRHFPTKGNLRGNYIGITDEQLMEDKSIIVTSNQYPMVEEVFTSPLKRCVQTASIIYPAFNPIIEPGFCECNFGDFENKNYQDLYGNESYQKWIDSNGSIPFPNGESRQEFNQRVYDGFYRSVITCLRKGFKEVAFVVHGGTIMSILEQFASPHHDLYYWQVKNGGGYVISLDYKDWIGCPGILRVISEI